MFISISSHIRDTVPDSLSLKHHHNSAKGTQDSPWTSANSPVLTEWAREAGWYLHVGSASSWPGLLSGCWPAPGWNTSHLHMSFAEGVNKITPTCIWKYCTAAQDCWKPQVLWPHCYKVKGHATWYQGQLGGRDQCTAGKWCNTDCRILYLLMVCFIVLHA